MSNKKILLWSDPLTVKQLMVSIKQDQISIVSTDTILGFFSSLSKKSFDQLNDLKGERQQKPYVILIGSYDKIETFVDVAALDIGLKNILRRCWPAPVTFVFKARHGVAKHLVSLDGTIALRCPRHPGLQTVLAHCDGLFSTSANKSGQPVPESVEQLDQDLIQKVTYVVVDSKTDMQSHQPSTIVDVSKQGKAKIIRSGAFPIDELLQQGLQIS